MPSRSPQHSRLYLLAAGMICFMITGAAQGVVGPSIPLFEARFAIDTATASWILSCLGIGGFASLVILYVLGPRITPKLALGFMALGAAGLSMAPGFATAALGALVFGLGFGSAAAIFNQRVLTAFGPRGTSMLSLLNAAFSVGSISAPLAFLASGSRPELVFGSVALVAILTLFIAEGAAPAPQAATPGPKVGHAPTIPFRFHFPILAFGLIGIGIEVSLAGLGPTGLIRAGIAPDEASRLLSGHFLALLMGRLGLALLGGRLEGFAIFTLAAIATAGLALGAALVDPGLFFVILGFFSGFFFPGYYVTATAKMGDDPRVSPVILATAQIGVVSVPLIVARLLPLMGDRGFFWLIFAMALGVSLCALASYRRMARITPAAG
jgi:fucose permease